MTNTGKVISIQGPIVEVEFLDDKPIVHDILVLEDDPGTILEVVKSSTTNFCLPNFQ